MRRTVFLLAFGAGLGLAACGGETRLPGAGDPFVPPGDPGVDGDALSPGDDSPPAVLTPSVQLCGAGGRVASATYHGVLCLSPLGSGGQVSASASYRLISAPAHIVEAE